jgi:hypothetical protein
VVRVFVQIGILLGWMVIALPEASNNENTRRALKLAACESRGSGRRSPGFLEEPVDRSGSDPLATMLAAHEVVRSEKAKMGGSQQFCH